jgi:hypothetical protein
MKNGMLALCVLLLAASLEVEGSPVEPVGPRMDVVLAPYRRLVESRIFAANQRANIIAIGRLRDGTFLGLYVYDVHGNCVAWDDLGNSSTRDDLAVEWFPMRTERYTNELRNLGAASNRLDLVIR